MKVGDRVRVKKDGHLCWAKSGKVYVPGFYIGYVTYVNHGNGNLMVHLGELDGSVQTSIEHWIEVEYEE
jgi:hypothetical protein